MRKLARGDGPGGSGTVRDGLLFIDILLYTLINYVINYVINYNIPFYTLIYH